MIKGVLTHHPIRLIVSNVQQKVNYFEIFNHSSTLITINPVTTYKFGVPGRRLKRKISDLSF